MNSQDECSDLKQPLVAEGSIRGGYLPTSSSDRSICRRARTRICSRDWYTAGSMLHSYLDLPAVRPGYGCSRQSRISNALANKESRGPSSLCSNTASHPVPCTLLRTLRHVPVMEGVRHRMKGTNHTSQRALLVPFSALHAHQELHMPKWTVGTWTKVHGALDPPKVQLTVRALAIYF